MKMLFSKPEIEHLKKGEIKLLLHASAGNSHTLSRFLKPNSNKNIKERLIVFESSSIFELVAMLNDRTHIYK